jgi:hypothetical protein
VRPSSTPYCGLTFHQDKVVKAAQLGLLGHAIIRRHFFLSYSDPRYRYKQKVKEANAKRKSSQLRVEEKIVSNLKARQEHEIKKPKCQRM